MKNKMMSVLFASGNESKLNELTIHRTTASLPFAGRYRLIDFALSNLVNSGITRIGIITRNNYSSLMDHIRMGRDWDLNRKTSGIAVFPPYVFNTSREVYKGKIEAIYNVLDYIKSAPEDYIVMGNSNIACKINYDDVLQQHLAANAEITILCHETNTTSSRRIVIDKGEDNLIKDLYISETYSQDEKLISLNTYLLKKDLLIELVENAYAHGYIDFEKDILFKFQESNKFLAYEIKAYAAIIDDVKTYYNESMKILNGEIREQLFGENKIYTKVKDSVPTIYKENSCVKNSLIADGCTIDGTVENSILFRNVKVEKGAVIKNSIVMERGVIMSNSTLNYAILDKNVNIRDNRNISGFETYPIVIVKNKIV